MQIKLIIFENFNNENPSEFIEYLMEQKIPTDEYLKENLKYDLSTKLYSQFEYDLINGKYDVEKAFDLVRVLMNNKSAEINRLGLILSRGIQNYVKKEKGEQNEKYRKDILNELQKLWDKDNKRVNARLCWFLLSDKDEKTENYRAKVFEFIENNFEDFLRDAIEYRVEYTEMVKLCQIYLITQRYPVEKDFMYLLISFVSYMESKIWGKKNFEALKAISDLLDFYENDKKEYIKSDEITMKAFNFAKKKLSEYYKNDYSY